MNPALWQADRIRVTAQNKVLLEIPQLRLPEKKIIALIGPNGAGKSTLLRVLMGDYRAIRVYCNGLPVRRLVRQGKIALVGQHEHFELPLTVRDYVLLGCFPKLSWFAPPRQAEYARADALLATYDLHPLSQKRIQTLSGGEKQRAALVRALMQQTEYLLLDEPSNHLDIRHQHRLMADLRQRQHRQRLSIIMVLHDLNLAAHYADYILLLHQGRLLAAGSPHAVMTEARLSETYAWAIRRHAHADSAFFAAAPAGPA